MDNPEIREWNSCQIALAIIAIPNTLYICGVANPFSILSLTPYRVLPATTGGHWGIVSMHNALGTLCEDHLVGTLSNTSADAYSFHLHSVYPDNPKHYLPLFALGKIKQIAIRNRCQAIFCDHPYLAPTAISLSKQLKIPWFLRSHNIESERFRSLGKWWWKGMRAFEKGMMRNANGVFFITPEEQQWGMENYGIKQHRAHLAPYGTNLSKAPQGHLMAKSKLAATLGLDVEKPWLYFLGAMSYESNYQAVAHILNDLLPILQDRLADAPILIAGKGLPEDLQQQILATHGAVKYLGFVDNLEEFLQAMDVMINPVLSGGGIKTKAVEALAYNKMLVSTVNGAQGLDAIACQPNLLVAENGDWHGFANQIITAVKMTPDISATFYQHYNWDHIAAHVLALMKG